MSHNHCNCNDSCTIKKTERKENPLKKYIPAITSLVLLVAGIALDDYKPNWYSNYWVRLSWYIIAYIPVGLPVLKEAWESLLEKEYFNEFMLMGIATLGAFYIGEYPEGVAVMLFYAVGELFQDSAVDKAKRNISALLDVRPETAEVFRNEKLESVTPEQVQVGETIEVKSGGRVPLDGIMTSNVASFNTSALTGESIPRTIRKGEEVLAGMIATDNVAHITVTKPFNQSALTRILELVENATERKAPAENFIRKFAKIYTPAVVALATLIVLIPFIVSLVHPMEYSFNDWLYRGLVFLVISCPCALVISIPLGYFGGIGLASRNGILFKGSNYLDAITKVNTVVMDKTGTLTKGIFSVQEIVPERITKAELLKAVASLEMQSTHPIAKAIVEQANQQSLAPAQASEVKEIPGRGLKGTIDGSKVLAGNIKLMQIHGISYPTELADIPETIVICAINGTYAGYILVADAQKEDAKEAIDSLNNLKIENIVMLSGDKQPIVSKLATSLGIKQAYGDLLPEGKVHHVEALKKNPDNYIAFVGDGINDAPVLALSDVGIAMGGLGSDVAIETADVVIQTDHPSKIAMAIGIGKMTRRIIIQNITLAFTVKLIVLVFGAYGVATLWEAVFADVGVALLAILNATRLLHKKMDTPKVM